MYPGVESDNIKAFVDDHVLELCQKRAGNPKTSNLSFSNKIPKSIDQLGSCEPFTGHDAFLSGIFVYMDCNVSKKFRIQLLSHYKFINVISSSSLMHKFEDFKKEMKPKRIKEVDDVPMHWKYGITMAINYRQLKIIYKERRLSSDPEWVEFCDMIEKLPHSNWLTNTELTDISKQYPGLICPQTNEVTFVLHGETIKHIVWPTTYIILEHLCRYHDVKFSTDSLWQINNIPDDAVIGDFVDIVFTAPRETLSTIYNQRKNHKRKEWQDFCKSIEQYI